MNLKFHFLCFLKLRNQVLHLVFSGSPFSAHLEFVLLTADAGPLLLPEVVRLDDEGDVDLRREELLQHLEDGLHRRPRGPAHVDHHAEADVPHVVTAKVNKHDCIT